MPTKLAELKEKKESLLAEIQKEAQSFFNQEIKPLFAAHPALESFRWTQYTPYFNDGDECTFSAHTDDLTFNFDGKEYDYVSTYSLSNRSEKFPKEFTAAAKAVFKFMENFDSDDFEQMFGDHVEVIAKRDKVEVNEYSHD
jgi:hypothetical protein